MTGIFSARLYVGGRSDYGHLNSDIEVLYPFLVNSLKLWQTQMASLAEFTPGDFMAAKRRLRLTGLSANAEQLFEGLRAEYDMKSVSGRRKAGF